jgi:methionine-gamma-lyase
MDEKRTADRLAPGTRALCADRKLATGSGVAPEIAQSSTYAAQDAADFARRAEEPLASDFYTRHGDPTSARIAKIVADLEGAEAGMMFASGMGAISTTVLALVRAGDHVVGQRNHYAGTTRLLDDVLPRFGVEVTRVDQTDPGAFERALRPSTRLVLVETPANPTLELTDLEAVAALCRPRGIPTFCDNTFATPLLQRPLDRGIDVVMHSTTKYIGGHHDLLGGCVVGGTETVRRIWDLGVTIGAVAAPFSSWLALRGVRTLELRVRKSCAAALAIARHLEEHAAVERVHYPGLESSPQHELARRQMAGGFGGLLTFELRGGYRAAAAFVENVQLCRNASSLGGVDTVVVQPAAMWGGHLSDAALRAQGVHAGLVRMAVGIEDVKDLLDDVDRALAAAR